MYTTGNNNSNNNNVQKEKEWDNTNGRVEETDRQTEFSLNRINYSNLDIIGTDACVSPMTLDISIHSTICIKKKSHQ